LRFVLFYGGLEAFSHWHRPNNWYHVVGTYDGTVGRTYVDGVLEAATYSVKPPIINSQSLYINHHQWGGGAYGSQRMGGIIDEVHISKIARAPAGSPGFISGTVYDDLNGNGIKDSGEPGLENWRVDLFKNDLQVDSATTSASGVYTFNSVLPDTYTVRENVKLNWIKTAPLSGEYSNMIIRDGQSVLNKDFGNFKLGAISGLVFYDANGNGLIDEGENSLGNIKICLTGSRQDSTSTDDAGNYLFNNLPAGTYTVNLAAPAWWGTTYPPSGYYSVALTSSGQSLIDENFGLNQMPIRVKLALNIADASGISSKILYWGVRGGASNGIWGVDPQATVIDSSEEEFELPPVITGTFDARFRSRPRSSGLFGNGSWTDMRGFLRESQIDTYMVAFQPGPAGYPVTVKWSKLLIADAFKGSVTLGKNSGLTTDMKIMDSVVISNSNSSELYIIAAEPDLPIMYEPGWNMISVPNKVTDGRVNLIFHSYSTRAFSYNPVMGYEVKDTLDHGAGYWMKFSSLISSLLYSGKPLTKDTIDVNEGWNLIGTPSVPIPVNSITSIPPNIVTGNFFGYLRGYNIADVLEPTKGYWVKVNQTGKLILSVSGVLKGSSRIRIIPTSELPPSPPMETNVAKEIPKDYLLGQAYPNPFNPTAKIEYQLPVDSKVVLKVYNLLGQMVAILADEVQTAGYRLVEWAAGSNASGLYIYRIDAVSTTDQNVTFTQIKKVLLLK